jgi:hypothetical protein
MSEEFQSETQLANLTVPDQHEAFRVHELQIQPRHHKCKKSHIDVKERGGTLE